MGKPPYPIDIRTIWQHFNGTFWEVTDVDEYHVIAKRLGMDNTILFRKKGWHHQMTFESWGTSE